MIIRAAIVEDQPAVRENLATIIDSAPGFRCVSAVSSAEAAARELPVAAPEVVLMDLHLPAMSGIECVRRLKPELPSAQFIMLTIEEDSRAVFESLRAGAAGYLVKNVASEKILEAIADVYRGGSPISSSIARLLVRDFQKAQPRTDSSLSPRESEILSLLARGYRSKEAADDLGITVLTVNTHIRNIYEKLHVRSRAEAVARYLQIPR